MPPACTVVSCNNQLETRCGNCGFQAFFCLECCNSTHQDNSSCIFVLNSERENSAILFIIYIILLNCPALSTLT